MFEKKKYLIWIGIDPGVNTGVAVWNRVATKLENVDSRMIHHAMDLLIALKELYPENIFVRVEDARLRTWFPKNVGKEQLQGAGSIKRDAKIWEDFLTDHQIPFELVPPKNNKTKVKQEYFKQLTGWTQPTNEHARDAGMLVFGM